jgi:hypothetical protein
MTESTFDWENDEQEDPVEFEIFNAAELECSEVVSQTRQEILVLIRSIEERILRTDCDPVTRSDLLLRKQELESELDEDIPF